MARFRNPFSKKSDPTSPAGIGPSHGDRTESPQPRRYVVEPTPNTIQRLLGKMISGPSTDNRISSSPPTETPKPHLKSATEHATSNAGSGMEVFLPNSSTEPLPKISSGSTHPLDSLTEAWDAVRDGPSDSDLDQLRSSDAIVKNAQDDTAPFQPIITAAAGAVEQNTIAKLVEDRIDLFFDSMPVFIKALDEVAKLHPFVGIAVLAFKTAYTFERRRHRNEKKIIALYDAMKDMMGVLFLLVDVENDKLIASDGTRIEDRLRSLVTRTAVDIKLCSNVCDTYMKKRLLAKVISASIWDAKLLGFVRLFNHRRREFELSFLCVDGANAKLDAIEHKTHDLNEKMATLMAMFQQLVSPAEKELSALVTTNGGIKALRGNKRMLLALEETASKSSSTPSVEGHRPLRTKVSNVDDLKNDIFEDPGAAVERNRDVFFRKFEVQKNQIMEKLTLEVERESDRVIKEVKGGSHERIRDRSIHEIWKDMEWHGNVKSRHFVLALRDYYMEKLAPESTTIFSLDGSTIPDTLSPDAWTMKYIDIIRLQPILEAIDDDASGFITIREINRFTSSRPRDWSLPHWVAFWAVGFRASIINYAKRIEELFAKMEGVRSHVLPPNREAIDDYFTYVWEPIHTLTAAVISLQPGPNNPDKFKPYLEAEESRLASNLKAVDYIIDGTDTLALITGAGRIEKTLFPLLYLLMKRHYEIMRIMRAKVVDSRELWDAVESILYLRDAIRYRVGDLADTFSQQRLDPEKQFQNFAHGIFKYFYTEKALWTVDYVRSFSAPVIGYEDEAEDPNVKPEDILNYKYTDELPLDLWVYDGHSIDDTSDIGPPLRDIWGQWHGYFYEVNGIREIGITDSMITLVLIPARREVELKANAWSIRGRSTVTWSWSKSGEDALQIKLKMTFATASWAPMYFNGRFDPKRDALTGVWDVSEYPDSSSGKMEFRRIPPHHLTVYPSIHELSQNKTRELWRFAIAAVRNNIHRESWSWSYFSQRRDDRETVISLTIRSLYFGKPSDDEEVSKLHETVQRLTPSDACFYSSVINHKRTYTWVHAYSWCDSCNGRIGGARLFCLDCANKAGRPECIAARVTNREGLEGAHEPNHKLVKVRTVVLKRQYGRVHTAAWKAFEYVEKICMQIAEVSNQPEAGSNKSCVKYSFQESGDKTPINTLEVFRPVPKVESGYLPTCGNCNGHLSFPFWYCIFCEDELFICNSCDREGAPDLICASGKHTEEHHLIRCLAPERAEQAPSSSDQQHVSLEIEKRLDDVQTQFNDLSGRIGNIEQILHRLAARIG